MLLPNGTPQEAHADPVVLGYLTPPGNIGDAVHVPSPFCNVTRSGSAQCARPSGLCSVGAVSWPGWPGSSSAGRAQLFRRCSCCRPVGGVLQRYASPQLLREKEGWMEEKSSEGTRQERPVPAANGGRLCSLGCPLPKSAGWRCPTETVPPFFLPEKRGRCALDGGGVDAPRGVSSPPPRTTSTSSQTTWFAAPPPRGQNATPPDRTAYPPFSSSKRRGASGRWPPPQSPPQEKRGRWSAGGWRRAEAAEMPRRAAMVVGEVHGRRGQDAARDACCGDGDAAAVEIK